MSHVDRTAQEAEDAMILNQCNLQLAQVQFNNSKVDDENKLALHFLQEFQQAFKKMEKLQAEFKKKQDQAKKLQDVLRVVSIVGAVLACALGQPEIAVLIIVTTSLSMIKTNQTDKQGNTLSVMDVIVKDIAKALPGGDTPTNELRVSIGIAVVLTVLTCGGGGLLAASGMGLKTVLTLAPLALAISLGSTNLPQKVAAAIEADKQAMSNFAVFIGWFVQGINDCGGHVKMPSKEVLNLTLTLMITIAFVGLSLGAGLVTIGRLGSSSTVIGMLAQRFSTTARAAAEAASVAAQEVAEESTTAVSSVTRAGANSAWCFDDEIVSATRQAEEEGTELQEIVTVSAEEAGGAASGAVRGAANAGRGVAATTNVVGRVLTRAAAMMRSFTTWLRIHPVATVCAVFGLAYVINTSVEVYKEYQLGMNQLEQGQLIIEQGTYEVAKTNSSFQIKMINTVADNDSKVLQTQWQGDAALQEGFDRFSADTSAIANALLG